MAWLDAWLERWGRRQLLNAPQTRAARRSREQYVARRLRQERRRHDGKS